MIKAPEIPRKRPTIRIIRSLSARKCRKNILEETRLLEFLARPATSREQRLLSRPNQEPKHLAPASGENEHPTPATPAANSSVVTLAADSGGQRSESKTYAVSK